MDVTYNFTAGTRAVAGQVNQNFADVKSAVDVLETDVTELQNEVANLDFIKADGSVDFTRLQSYKSYVVSNATNATPIVITAVGHGFLTGDKVYISGVGGNTAANGVFTITKLGVDTFSLYDSVGNGAYAGGGSCIIYPVAGNNLASVSYIGKILESANPNLDTSNMPTLANNTSDANNDIDFSSGFCYDLSTNIKITNTALIKRLDATFTAGTNQGGLDTGTKAISTWYYCFAISKADGTADFLFSTSATAPTMPTGYINKRRIGSIKTDGSGNIKGFIQVGNSFIWKTPVLDFSGTVTTTSQLVTVSSPISIKSKLNINTSIATAGSTAVLITSPDTTDSAVSGSLAPLATVGFGTSGGQQNIEVYTNISSQIRLVAISTTSFYLSVISYEDLRGVN